MTNSSSRLLSCPLITSLAALLGLVPGALAHAQFTLAADPFSPAEVSYLGKTPFEIRGTGFTSTTTVQIGRNTLSGAALQVSGDGTRIAGITPLSRSLFTGPSAITVEESATGQLRSVLDAFDYIGPLAVTRSSPSAVPTNADAVLTITGVAFTPETTFSVYRTSPAGAVLLESPVFVNARTMRATLPRGLAAGRYTVLATDVVSGVAFTAAAAILDLVPPVPDIQDVQPRYFRPAGGEIIDITGVNLSASHTFRLGVASIAITSVNLRGTKATGRTPVMGPGAYTVDIFSPDLGVVDSFAGPVFVTEAPQLVSITPSTLPLDGGVEVEILGSGLAYGTRVTIGGRELRNIRPLADGRPDGISGLAPGGDEPGPVDVEASNPLGASALAGGARYLLEDRPPGPQQIEATLAAGEARFRWINPAPYQSIAVYAENGKLLEVLPGTATSFRASSLGEQSLSVRFEAVLDDGNVLTQRERATAVALDCDRPPPLESIFQTIRERFEGLEYEDVEHSLYGGHSEAIVTRCADGGGAERGGGGGALTAGHRRAGALEAGTGFIRRPLSYSLPEFAESAVATGFVLDRPASKLEIALHHRKIAAESGVELRGRIVQVYPDDGFEDEFTFPQTVISSQGDWNILNYFRADSDVGRPLLGPDDPGPKPCSGGLACGGVEIPAGEYLLEIYAVGGSRKTAYFVTASDPSPEELHIAGTPCPPYPLVRVRDVSDENTLPTVTGVVCTKLSPGIGSICPLTRPQRVRVAGLGYWLDSCNQSHPIETHDTRFEFRWKIFDSQQGTVFEWSHRNWVELCLDCGCYDVEVMVRKTGCPVTRTYRREIVVRPPGVPCDTSRPFSFFYPTPKPDGTTGIVGLNDPAKPLGISGEADRRPLGFRVLVSPNCKCPVNTLCAAAKPDDVEFDLGVKFLIQGGNTTITTYRTLGASFAVDDLCDDTVLGPKFLQLRLDDLGEVPASGLLDSFRPTNVYLVGRAVSGGGWQPIGGPMKLYNPPDSLAKSSWRGTFSPPAQYVFETRSSEGEQEPFAMGPSADLNFELPDVGDGNSQAVNLAGHPENGMEGGFSSRFSLSNGVWSDEEGVGGMRGAMMGNEISGAPIESKPGPQSFALRPDGAGGGIELPEYEWCNGGNIFNYEFKEDIYKGIIYAGTIWIIPVQVWASIGFGFFLNVDYQLTFKLHPFSVLQGYEAECPQNSRPPGQLSFADAYLYLLVDSGISIPASVRADILFGVASIGITLESQANFDLSPWLEAHDLQFSPHMHLGANFKLFAYVTVAAFWGLLEFTLPEDPGPIINEPIFECPKPPFDCVCPSCIEKCDDSTPRECPGEGGGARGTDGGGAGAVFELINVQELISIPETVVSPSGDTLIDVWMSADPGGEPSAPGGILNIRQRGTQDRDFQFALTGANPYFLDPSGAYISSNVAFMAFTETNGSALELPIPPLDPNNPSLYLAPSNRNAARANIRVHAIGPTTNNFAAFRNSGVDISEPSANIADWRADGSPSMASSSEVGEAWVAWVRYGGDFLVDRGMRTIVTTCRSCEPRRRYQTEVVRDIQPNLTSTQVVARRLGVSAAGGVTTIGPAAPLVLSTGGINIEPDVAVADDGQSAACVWVHDGLHQNLVDDNRGRNLLFSHWRRVAPNSWSVPVPVVPPELLDRFPGILEPRLAMGYNDDELLEGIIAWTAVPEGSEPNDTGMGGLRYLYTSRLHENGSGSFSFDDPVRIRGRCEAPIYGWDHSVFWELPEVVDPQDSILLRGPDAVILYSQRGLPGTRASAGDLMMTALGEGMTDWTPPVCLTDGTRTITNSTATVTPQGMVHTMFLDQGASAGQQRRGATAGAGAGGGAAPSGYQAFDYVLGPDLAIESCKLSHPFAAPGSMVKVSVEVENRGFASSAIHNRRGPQPRVRILYRSEDGIERAVVGSSRLPLLTPGSSTAVELEVEAPHEPVELVVRLEDNFKDIDPTNDVRTCDFGSPCPVGLTCHAVRLDDEDRSAAAVVEWENPVLYEDLYVYRNEVLLTTLSGSSERFVDSGLEPGEYAYEVRGAVGVSRSIRPRCVVTITPAPAGELRRGDTNDDGKVDISDPVATLAFLFLGGAVPVCRDASDSNDDGKVDISDGVHTLAFLFLGGDAPPAPGPFTCGVDPTDDALGVCAARCGRQ